MPVQIFQQTTNKYEDTEIDANALLRSVQFAVSAPYSALYQIAKKNANGQPVFDGAELIAQPGQGGFQQNIYGIRFKSFDPVHVTTVLCKAFFEDDPVPTGDLASTSTFNTGGQVTPGGSSVQVQKNGVLVGTEPILDFLDSDADIWQLVDDLPGTRITITAKSVITAYIIGASGAIQFGTGRLTCVRNGIGIYTITMSPLFGTGIAFGAVAIDSAGGNWTYTVGILGGSAVAVRTFNGGVAADPTAFSIMAFSLS